MLIVVMMGRWSDESVCSVVHNVQLYSVLDIVVISALPKMQDYISLKLDNLRI